MAARASAALCRIGGRRPTLTHGHIFRPSFAVQERQRWPRQSRFCSDGGEAAESAPTEEELKAKIAVLKEEIAEVAEKRSHIKHDTDQAQRRHRTDLDNESKFGITKLAKDVLKVDSNLDRATESVKQEELDSTAGLKELHDRVKKLQGSLGKVFADFGVAKMNALDEEFDPSKHEAMFAMPMPGKEPNKVFHVMEPGYMIHDRTLRAAKVGVTQAAA
mmetsp:Transcript_49178/g.117112  ORF Transcript_49178/g.117112 Transcript_49178/m.117112 type:complete len:218 (+) Transcript_49178:71-724(+)